jgi:hypothetical protein
LMMAKPKYTPKEKVRARNKPVVMYLAASQMAVEDRLSSYTISGLLLRNKR